jgi:hypothetical protein
MDEFPLPVAEETSEWRQMFRPNPGWLFALAGMIAAYIIGEFHAPLWLAILTFFVLLITAGFWRWAHLVRRRMIWFWCLLIGYLIIAGILTATLRERTPEQMKTEQTLLGLEYNQQELSSKFPLGYVVFRLDPGDKIEFYKGLSLIENYDFDWSKVEYLSNTEHDFKVQMPDVVPKTPSGGVRIIGNKFGGPKRVGFWFMYYETADFKIVDEVLDVDKNGVVFVIGLMKPRPR